jgi:hypothetical protein
MTKARKPSAISVNSKHTTTKNADAKIVTACLGYSMTISAVSAAFEADPDGNSKNAARITGPYYERATKYLITATTPAATMIGLSAKARIVPIVLLDAEGTLEEENENFLSAFAADVQRLVQDAVDADWRAAKAEKGGAA